MAGSRFSERPKPNRLRGLIGGTGGGTVSSMPFFSEAPGGRLTRSMTDVVETNTGSPMSALTIDFLRSVPTLTMGGGLASGLKAALSGVPGLDAGGVFAAEAAGRGEAWARNEGLGPPGEGRGDTGSPGECWGRPPGDRRAAGLLVLPFPIWIGLRCFLLLLRDLDLLLWSGDDPSAGTGWVAFTENPGIEGDELGG